jgi:hypothetical protein
MSFKDQDETPAQKKEREYNENPKNFPAIRPVYCQACGCHYSNGCKEHSASVQVTLVTPVTVPAKK